MGVDGYPDVGYTIRKHMEGTLTEQEVYDRLSSAVVAAGGQRAFAALHGLTPMYVNDVLHKRRALADKILSAIGVKREIVRQVIYTEEE